MANTGPSDRERCLKKPRHRGGAEVELHTNSNSFARPLAQAREVNSMNSEFREVRGWRSVGTIIRRHWPIVAEHAAPHPAQRCRLAPGTDKAPVRNPPSARQLAEEGGAA